MRFDKSLVIIIWTAIGCFLSLPSMAQTNGFGRACADLFSKSHWTKTEEVATSAQGEDFTFMATLNHQTIPMKGKVAPERERRMNLPHYPLKVEERTIQNAEDLIRDLLDKFSRPIRYIPDGPMIWIRALKNKEARWHDHSPSILNERGEKLTENSLFSTVIHGEKYRWIDRQLENVPNGLWKDKKTLERIQELSDSYQMNYIVRKQFERGLYFDTASGALAKNNVALRIKQWSPANNDGKPSSTPTAQMLFVKVTAPKSENNEAFHLRTEYQVPIPIGYGTAEATAIGQALLEHLGITISPQETIKPIKEVSNLRYGFDLVRGRVRGGIRKIGFITVDTFSVKSLDTGISSSPINQMEVELLPKYQKLKDDKDLAGLFKVLDARYNVKVSTTPKYQQ